MNLQSIFSGHMDDYDGPWVERRIEWKCPDRTAHRVEVFGSWNRFRYGDPLEYNGKQIYAETAILPLGNYLYRFMIDGEEWATNNATPKTVKDGIKYNTITVEDIDDDSGCDKASSMNSFGHFLKSQTLYSLNRFDQCIKEGMIALNLNKTDEKLKETMKKELKDQIELCIKQVCIVDSKEKESCYIDVLQWLYDADLLDAIYCKRKVSLDALRILKDNSTLNEISTAIKKLNSNSVKLSDPKYATKVVLLCVIDSQLKKIDIFQEEENNSKAKKYWIENKKNKENVFRTVFDAKNNNDRNNNNNSNNNSCVLFDNSGSSDYVYIKDNKVVHNGMQNSWHTAFGKHLFNANENNHVVVRYTMKIVHTQFGIVEIGVTGDTSLRDSSCGDKTVHGDNYGISLGIQCCKFNNDNYVGTGKYITCSSGDIIVIQLNLIDNNLSFRYIYNHVFDGIVYKNMKRHDTTGKSIEYRLAVSLLHKNDCVSIEKVEIFDEECVIVQEQAQEEQEEVCVHTIES